MANMENQEEFTRRIQERIDETRRYSCARIGEQGYTCASVYSPITRSQYEPVINTNDQIKISVLTEENEKLKREYADLLKRTTFLLDAYKKLEGENKEFKEKRLKKDSLIKTVDNTKNFFNLCKNQFINWLKT